jgi:hypothetical protein
MAGAAPQARAAVDAAVAAGVSLIAYASFVNAETSTLRLAEEHKDTEAHIRKSGMRHVLLRNGAYTELYGGELGDLGPALDAGVLVGSGGDGIVSGSTRPDLAAAAAAVLLTDDPEGRLRARRHANHARRPRCRDRAPVRTLTRLPGPPDRCLRSRSRRARRPAGLRRTPRRHQLRHQPRRLVHRQHGPRAAHRATPDPTGRLRPGQPRKPVDQPNQPLKWQGDRSPLAWCATTRGRNE